MYTASDMLVLARPPFECFLPRLIRLPCASDLIIRTGVAVFGSKVWNVGLQNSQLSETYALKRDGRRLAGGHLDHLLGHLIDAAAAAYSAEECLTSSSRGQPSLSCACRSCTKHHRSSCTWATTYFHQEILQQRRPKSISRTYFDVNLLSARNSELLKASLMPTIQIWLVLPLMFSELSLKR